MWHRINCWQLRCHGTGDGLLHVGAYAVGRFQREGVEFAVRHGGRALIADDMGLGKTVQVGGPPALLHPFFDCSPVWLVLLCHPAPLPHLPCMESEGQSAKLSFYILDGLGPWGVLHAILACGAACCAAAPR